MVKGRRHLIYQNVRKTQLNWVLDCTKLITTAKTTKLDENTTAKKVESYIYIFIYYMNYK